MPFYGLISAQYNGGMKLITGKVVDGRVELPPGEIADGTIVAVVTSDNDEPVVLSAEDERELADRLEAIAQGEFVDGDEFLKQLKARHRG